MLSHPHAYFRIKYVERQRAVAQHLVTRRRNAASEESLLSEREQRVLELLVDGATNESIAGSLYVSEKTVKSHLSSIFRKLGVTNRTQAVSKAIRERPVKLPDVSSF